MLSMLRVCVLGSLRWRVSQTSSRTALKVRTRGDLGQNCIASDDCLVAHLVHVCRGTSGTIDAAMKASDIPFYKLCEFFDDCLNHRKSDQKLKRLRKFCANIDRTSDDVYEVYRLILPAVSFLASDCWLS